MLAAVALSAHPGAMWVVAFIYSAGSQVFSSSEMALVVAVQAKALARAHLYLAGLQYAGQGVAAAALVVLLLGGGPRTALIAATLLYAVLIPIAVMLQAALRGRRHAHPYRARPAFAFGETFRLLRQDRWAAYAVGLLAFVDMAMRGAIVAVPRYLRRDLELSQAQTIAVFVSAGLGAAIGLVWILRSFHAARAPGAMRAALVSAASVFALLAVGRPALETLTRSSRLDIIADAGGSTEVALGTTLALALVLGFCLSVAPVVARTALSARVPAGHQARVFATQATLTHATAILPLVLTGLMAQTAGPRPTLFFLSLCGALLLLALHRATPRPLPVP
jgi:hypothetical protein